MGERAKLVRVTPRLLADVMEEGGEIAGGR